MESKTGKRPYKVTITVTYRYGLTVDASSEEEAKKAAELAMSEDGRADPLDAEDVYTDILVLPAKDRPSTDGLPSIVMVDCGEAGIDASMGAEEAAGILSDWLSDTYGFCHYGFDYELVDGTAIVSDIKWDVDGEDDYA